MLLTDNSLVKEIFLGISPTGLRIIEPATLEPELIIDKLQVCDLKYGQYLGNSMVKIKFYQETSKGGTKIKKTYFHVLPVTGQDILRWYDFCCNLGEEANDITYLPSFKIPSETVNASVDERIPNKKYLQRGCSVTNLQRQKNESSQSQSFSNTDSHNKENVPPRRKKSITTKPTLLKSRSFLTLTRLEN